MFANSPVVVSMRCACIATHSDDGQSARPASRSSHVSEAAQTRIAAAVSGAVTADGSDGPMASGAIIAAATCLSQRAGGSGCWAPTPERWRRGPPPRLRVTRSPKQEGSTFSPGPLFWGVHPQAFAGLQILRLWFAAYFAPIRFAKGGSNQQITDDGHDIGEIHVKFMRVCFLRDPQCPSAVRRALRLDHVSLTCLRFPTLLGPATSGCVAT